MSGDASEQLLHGPVELSLSDLAGIVRGKLSSDEFRDMRVTLGPRRVTVHSDLAEPGAVFFALRGKSDGHRWVGTALRNGASVAVVANDSTAVVEDNAPLLHVDDPLEALQRLAAWYRRRLPARFIAITGSIGKTSAKDALVSFLSESEQCYGSPGSFNSQLGVPLSVLWCPHDAASAVIEVAVTEPGGMERLAHIVKPAVVVITKVGDRYVRNFGRPERYLEELSLLARDLPPGGVMVNGDASADFTAILPTTARIVTPHSTDWPLVSIERTGARRSTITVRAPSSSLARIDVESSSSWLTDDVALAAATATLIGNAPASQSYSPTSLDWQTWKSPNGVRFLRSAAVDEPMAWRAAVTDALDAEGTTGRIFFVLSDVAHVLSRRTLATLASVDAARTRAIYVTRGPAAQTLAELARVPVRVFESSVALAQSIMSEVRADDVVALFTGRGELLEGISAALFDAMAPTKLYIDVGAIEANLAQVRRQCRGARVMSVVKAGAYGVDAPELARHLAAAGVDEFAVSHADEGVALRRSGVSRPILVLLSTPDELDKSLRSRLMICVHSEELLRAVLLHPSTGFDVHVEIDTGMHRTGLPPAAVIPALVALRTAGVRVRGIMTHLAGADDPAMDDFTEAQLRCFDSVTAEISAAGVAMPHRHALASSGIIRFPGHAMEMVRVGLALLGVPPSPDCRELALVPALTLVSRLIDRRVLQAGDRVGYGGTYRADRQMVAGVVQLGYYDGIFRSFATRGAVVVDGHRCPVIGRVSMDSLVVDLSEAGDAEVGSDVLVFGTRGKSTQSIEEVADAMQTIPYEVISRLGPRVQRVFIRH